MGHEFASISCNRDSSWSQPSRDACARARGSGGAPTAASDPGSAPRARQCATSRQSRLAARSSRPRSPVPWRVGLGRGEQMLHGKFVEGLPRHECARRDSPRRPAPSEGRTRSRAAAAAAPAPRRSAHALAQPLVVTLVLRSATQDSNRLLRSLSILFRLSTSSDSVSAATAVGGCRSAVAASRYAVGGDVAGDGDAGDPEQPGGGPHREPPATAPAGSPSSGRVVGEWERGAAHWSLAGPWSCCSPPPTSRQPRAQGAAGALRRRRALRRCARGPGSGPTRSAAPAARPRAAVPGVRGSSPPGAGRRARRPAVPPPRLASRRSFSARAWAAAGACAPFRDASRRPWSVMPA